VREVWRVAAEVVVGVHFGFLVYVAGGGFLGWRWPRSIVAHLVAVGWGVAGVVTPLACPLTGLQDLFRRWAGEPPLRGGFVDQYIEGVLYPERFTPLVRLALVAAVAVSWAGVARRRTAVQGVAGGVTGR
jgi:hypothetical protein